MSYRVTFPYRRALYALACALGLVLVACSGGGGDVTAPDPAPPTGAAPTGSARATRAGADTTADTGRAAARASRTASRARMLW